MASCRSNDCHGPAIIAAASDLAALAALEAALRATLPMARIDVQSLPGCDGLRLGLINRDFPDAPLPAEVMRAVLAAPAYWAFCWGSGLALARWIHAHPDWVRGRSVVDFGAGSGVAAIACKQSGASRVVACDNDPAALTAIRANARLNDVDIEVIDSLEHLSPGHDLLVMADVLYDRSNLPLLQEVRRYAERTLVADSRLRTLPDAAFRTIAEIEARTFPNLGEFDEFSTVRLFLDHAG